jgi:hypothetical protein
MDYSIAASKTYQNIYTTNAKSQLQFTHDDWCLWMHSVNGNDCNKNMLLMTMYTTKFLLLHFMMYSSTDSSRNNIFRASCSDWIPDINHNMYLTNFHHLARYINLSFVSILPGLIGSKDGGVQDDIHSWTDDSTGCRLDRAFSGIASTANQWFGRLLCPL